MFKKIKEFKTDYLQLINWGNDFLDLCFLYKSLSISEQQKTILQNIFNGLLNTEQCFLKDGYVFCKDLIKINYYFNNNYKILQIQFELLKDNKETKELKKTNYK